MALKPPKPKFLKPIQENIPDELKQYKSWVVWREELSKDEKLTKMPYNAKTGMRASSTGERTWSDFHTAFLRCKNANGKYDGIGFVLSDNDPFTGIDLDHCRDSQTGKIKDWAMEIINTIRSYTEISPSRSGIRIFTLADLPTNGRKSSKVEIYKKARYLTITGHRYDGI
jgi:primase-polymerase (primpol)-like protein